MQPNSIYHQSVTSLVNAFDPSDIVVVIGHPFGDVEMSLTAWIARGPGRRPLVRPVAARSLLTGDALPLSVIPLRYRNDEQSRRAIAAGLVQDPWPTGEEAADPSPSPTSNDG
jgi:hypothetical protein